MTTGSSTTLSSGSPRDHITAVRNEINSFFPGVTVGTLHFFSLKQAVRVFGVEAVPRTAILDERSFVAELGRLLDRRLQWIRIAGEGFVDEHSFLCGYDSAHEEGTSATLVEVLGPPLLANRTPRMCTWILPGLLEDIATILNSRGATETAQQVLSMDRMRLSSKRIDPEMSALSKEQLEQFEQAVGGVKAMWSNGPRSTGISEQCLRERLRLLDRLLTNVSHDARLA